MCIADDVVWITLREKSVTLKCSLDCHDVRESWIMPPPSLIKLDSTGTMATNSRSVILGL